MKKKTVSAPRPQPAQIQAIERCIERGELDKANERLLRLQAAFPDFRQLKRMAFEIALDRGYVPGMVAAAWDWCEASSNSAMAFSALLDFSIQGGYPYLSHHAAERLRALGESVPDEVAVARESSMDTLGEEEGRRLDLARVFMLTRRFKEARVLVETIAHPVAQNNFAQILFSEGDIEQAAEILESVLAKNPDNNFALYRLATLRMWLSGKVPAADLNERLQATVPTTLDELCHQMESALFFDQAARADEIYRLAPDFPWYGENGKYDPKTSNTIRYLGAMAAWRLDNHPEALRRIRGIGENNDEYGKIRAQCFLADVEGDTPDWMLCNPSQWWPIPWILSKKIEDETELFDNWQKQMPVPHFDYLVAVAMNSGEKAQPLALSMLRYLANGDLREEARQALLALLRLPCGPDSVRNKLHGMMIEEGLLDDKTPVKIFTLGRLIEMRPLTITIINAPMGEETVLSAADAKRYERVNRLANDDLPRALEIMEDLLSRYPDYPRILTAAASLRRGNGEPLERWAPLVRHAAEIEPDYLFSRVCMIQLLVAENRIEEARESLKPLMDLKEMHSSEWRAILIAQIRLAQATGDFAAVARLLTMLKDFDRSMGR
jgi:tetratricopeptide (TPR) repeat protein